MKKHVILIDTVLLSRNIHSLILNCWEYSAKIDAIIIIFNNYYYKCILPVRDELRLSV